MMAIYHAITNRFTKPVIEQHEARGREQGRTEGREEGRTEGREEGIAEGREEGLAEGVEQSNKAWREWLRGRDEAEAEGRPFDEPPPDEQPRRNGER